MGLEQSASELERIGGFDTLKRFLKSDDNVLRRRAAATICNISSIDSFSSIIRNHKCIEALVHILEDDKNPANSIAVINNVTAALLNICLNSKFTDKEFS